MPANTPSGFLNDAANPSNPTPSNLVGSQTALAATAPLSGEASTPPSGYGTAQAYDLSDLFQSGVIPATLPSMVITQNGYVLNRRTNRVSEVVTVTNMLGTAVTNPVYLAVNGLSSNTSLFSPAGVTVNSSPVGSPYVLVSGAGLANGAAASVVLQFANPASGSITASLSAITTTP